MNNDLVLHHDRAMSLQWEVRSPILLECMVVPFASQESRPSFLGLEKKPHTFLCCIRLALREGNVINYQVHREVKNRRVVDTHLRLLRFHHIYTVSHWSKHSCEGISLQLVSTSATYSFEALTWEVIEFNPTPLMCSKVKIIHVI